MDPNSGAGRMEEFKRQIRGGGVSLTLMATVDNMEHWEVRGPDGYTQFIAIIGEHGFSLFLSSETVDMAADAETIRKRVIADTEG